MWENLAAAPSAPFVCLLSMRTTTYKTFTQSKTFYISCCQHSISCQILYHLQLHANFLYTVASLLLWCSELVSRRLLIRSLQSSPSVCSSATQKVILVKFVLLVS